MVSSKGGKCGCTSLATSILIPFKFKAGPHFMDRADSVNLGSSVQNFAPKRPSRQEIILQAAD